MMARRLRKRGFDVTVTNLREEPIPLPPSQHAAGCEACVYDSASLLNLLDRCSHPGQLLAKVADTTCTLVVAIPFPYTPWYNESAVWQLPEEPLSLPLARESPAHADHNPQLHEVLRQRYPGRYQPRALTWEQHVVAMCEDLIEPLGFEVVSISRVPYLSRVSSTGSPCHHLCLTGVHGI
mmetsp:Transcript_2909/g.4465  ORF Transcript_2909/g.4465 Transcript_2909/m.4465 type:complete len:180 (+) Transcript_2909:889-1428(+)